MHARQEKASKARDASVQAFMAHESGAKKTARDKAKHQVHMSYMMQCYRTAQNSFLTLALCLCHFCTPSCIRYKTYEKKRGVAVEAVAKRDAKREVVVAEEREQKQHANAEVAKLRKVLADDGGCRSLKDTDGAELLGNGGAAHSHETQCRYALSCPQCCLLSLSVSSRHAEHGQHANRQWHRPGELCRECVLELCPHLGPTIERQNADYASAERNLHDRRHQDGQDDDDDQVDDNDDWQPESARGNSRRDEEIALRATPSTVHWFEQHPRGCAIKRYPPSVHVARVSCIAADVFKCGHRCCGGFVAKGRSAHPALNMCESCFQHECNGAGAHAVLSIAPTPAPTRLSFATAEAIARKKEEVHITEQKAKVRWCLFLNICAAWFADLPACATVLCVGCCIW